MYLKEYMYPRLGTPVLQNRLVLYLVCSDVKIDYFEMKSYMVRIYYNLKVR